MAWPDGLPGQEEIRRSDSAWARAEHLQGFVLTHHSFTKGQGLLRAGAASFPCRHSQRPQEHGSKGPFSRAVQGHMLHANCQADQASTPSLSVQVTMGKNPLPLATSPFHGLGNPTRASLAGQRELLDLWCRVVAIIICVKDPPVWSLPKKDPEKKREGIWGGPGHNCSFRAVLGRGRSKGPTSGPGHPDRHSTQLVPCF